MVQCPICQKDFAAWSALEKHRDATRHFYCYYCSEQLSSQKRYRDHNKAFHRKCNICSFLCRNEEHVERHSAREHVCCFSCKEVVATAEDLKTHVSAHHNFHCPHCYSAVASEASLLVHRKNAKHWYLCSLCDDTFPVKEDRDKHVSITHWGCRYCERFFKTARLLERHMKARHGCGCVSDVASDCSDSEAEEELTDRRRLTDKLGSAVGVHRAGRETNHTPLPINSDGDTVRSVSRDVSSARMDGSKKS